MKFSVYFILFMLALGCNYLSAQDGLKHTITLKAENDFWSSDSTDQFYTNGIRLECLEFPASFGSSSQGDPNSILRMLGLYDTSKRSKNSFMNGYVLAQNIYTPRNIATNMVNPADRPYGAWLYFGILSKIYNRGGKVLDAWEFDFGVVGPAALGDEVQSWFHRVIDGINPTWVDQIPNMLGVNATFKQQRIIWEAVAGSEEEFHAYLVPTWQIRAGSVFIDAAIGAKVAFGYNMGLPFSAGELSPSLYHLGDKSFGWSVYFGFESRYVAHNIFTYADHDFEIPRTFERNNLVSDAFYGATLKFKAFKLPFLCNLRIPESSISFTRAYRTSEIDTFESAHVYAQFAIGFTW